MEIDLFGNIVHKETEVDFIVEKESPFVYMNYISNKTYPERLDGYNCFLTNLGFSQRQDAVIFANEMNKYAELNIKEQFDFYFYSLPKKNYFAKWAKKLKTEDTQMIMEYFNVSYKVAKQYEKILKQEQLEQIKKWYETRKGGK